MTAPFARALLGWKPSGKNKLGWPLVPNFADVDNAESMRIAAGVLDALGVARDVTSDVPKDPGGPLEQAVCDHLGWAPAAPRTRTAAGWSSRGHGHHPVRPVRAPVSEVTRWSAPTRSCGSRSGMDYLIKPDVTVSLARVRTASGLPPLHAAISCKWTIRSDRVQNIRHECLQMIRHRRGRQPHLVTVTAEPLPSRLASIARGTGEVDAVYHIAYDAMAASVAEQRERRAGGRLARGDRPAPGAQLRAAGRHARVVVTAGDGGDGVGQRELSVPRGHNRRIDERWRPRWA